MPRRKKRRSCSRRKYRRRSSWGSCKEDTQAPRKKGSYSRSSSSRWEACTQAPRSPQESCCSEFRDPEQRWWRYHICICSGEGPGCSYDQGCYFPGYLCKGRGRQGILCRKWRGRRRSWPVLICGKSSYHYSYHYNKNSGMLSWKATIIPSNRHAALFLMRCLGCVFGGSLFCQFHLVFSKPLQNRVPAP